MINRKRFLIVISLVFVIILSACGNNAVNTPTSNNANQHIAETSDHGHLGSESNHQSNDTGHNPPVSLSDVNGVVASTSLTALVAKAAGAEQVTYLAPAELRHPPEYDYRPSDISKVKDSYLVYLGYEPFMSKLMEASHISSEMAATIELDNTPESYKNATKKLAEIWSTQEEQAKFEAELHQLASELLELAKANNVAEKKVVSQVYMTPILKWLGFEIIGEFGPSEMTPSQVAELANLKPDLIVDNLHMPQGAGISEVSQDTTRVELRSYPTEEMVSLLEILKYNAKQLGLE